MTQDEEFDNTTWLILEKIKGMMNRQNTPIIVYLKQIEVTHQDRTGCEYKFEKEDEGEKTILGKLEEMGAFTMRTHPIKQHMTLYAETIIPGYPARCFTFIYFTAKI